MVGEFACCKAIEDANLALATSKPKAILSEVSESIDAVVEARDSKVDDDDDDEEPFNERNWDVTKSKTLSMPLLVFFFGLPKQSSLSLE